MPHSCNHQGLPRLHRGYLSAPRGSPCNDLGSCCAPQPRSKGLFILKSLGSLLQVRPAVNQVEVHPYFRNQALIDYCAKEGVHVTAYSSLGTPSSAGHLVKKSAPNPAHVSGSLSLIVTLCHLEVVGTGSLSHEQGLPQLPCSAA